MATRIRTASRKDGAYEIAKYFYSEYVPESEVLVERSAGSADPERAKSAQALRTKLDEVLASADHKWYLGQMSPEEKEKRRNAAEEFRKRYEQK